MTPATLRAWWSRKQGLDGSLAGKSAAEVLERSGWARSVGGVGPYLTLFSRAGLSREAVDQAVAQLEIHELPSARGCTYVVPASDFAVALKVGQGFSAESELKTARKLGVTDAEIERLRDKITGALAKGPLDPDGLREAVGGAVRNLGEEGKKKGLITTMPLALGLLQSAGEIRRIPVNGRLDQQRYRYALWKPNPLAKFKLSREEAYTELARRFFRWIGPATLPEFQWFSGLGAGAAKAAVAPLELEPMEDGSDRLLLAEDREAFQAFRVPRTPQYSLVSGVDAIVLLRRDVRSALADEDLGRKVFGEKGYQPAGLITDLPSNGIFDRGRLVGLWEYDMDGGSIAWSSFCPKDKALAAAVKNTEKYVRSQLGDARSFSLDSPKSRAPRIAALRKSG
ncbi:MAG: winged helix DNA-binding domain-containing protein [Candidatus Solibacter usitatus]|nr:winged helix DNA-binding domain-containing protein [Candidatus Solibacter usitatus]